MDFTHLGNDGRAKLPVFTRVINGVMGSFFSWDCRGFLGSLDVNSCSGWLKDVGGGPKKTEKHGDSNQELWQSLFPNCGLVIPFSLLGSFTKG